MSTAELHQHIEDTYATWAENRLSCRCVIAASVVDNDTLRLLDNMEQQCAVAGWETLNMFRLCPTFPEQPAVIQRSVFECVKRLKSNADIVLFWNTGKDIDSAFLAAYLMSARVPVIVLQKPLLNVWQFDQLCYCKSVVDLQLFLDNYLRCEDMPSVEQRLRRAATAMR